MLSTAGHLYYFTKEKLILHRIPQISSRVVSFSASETHNICLDEQGVVWSWGENNQGELGFGDAAPRQVPYPSSFFKEKRVVKVIAGEGYSIALVKKK